MYDYIKVLLLAITVSVDGFGIGLAYGVRRIRFRLKSIIIIMICSGSAFFISMKMGSFLQYIVPVYATKYIGGTILIAIGLFSIKNLLSVRRENENVTASDIPLMETFLLGCVLSLDSFGVGLSAAFLNYPILKTSIVIMIMSGCFIRGGVYMGLCFQQDYYMKKLTLLSPILLITIGLYSILLN